MQRPYIYKHLDNKLWFGSRCPPCMPLTALSIIEVPARRLNKCRALFASTGAPAECPQHRALQSGRRVTELGEEKTAAKIVMFMATEPGGENCLEQQHDAWGEREPNHSFLMLVYVRSLHEYGATSKQKAIFYKQKLVYAPQGPCIRPQGPAIGSLCVHMCIWFCCSNCGWFSMDLRMDWMLLRMVVRRDCAWMGNEVMRISRQCLFIAHDGAPKLRAHP